MATINTSSQTITATVNLETGTDSMGQLVSDGTLDYVWVTDETNGGDVIQNLNPAVSDPASQPYVTAVGGTSFGHGTATLGPPPAEQVWNDQLYYSEGAGGGGISQTFAMPALPAGARHGHRQHRDALRDVERRLPRDPGRLGRRRPEHRVHRLRQREPGWLERPGGDERRDTAVGGGAGRRRLGRREHRRLRRAEPCALPPGPAVPGHLSQRRDVREQRLQRHRRWPVPRHGGLRHGHRPRARRWRRRWRPG